MSEFNSPIFGPTREATENEKAQLEKLAEDVPAALFQVLNKKLNGLGFMLSMDVLREG